MIIPLLITLTLLVLWAMFIIDACYARKVRKTLNKPSITLSTWIQRDLKRQVANRMLKLNAKDCPLKVKP